MKYEKQPLIMSDLLYKIYLSYIPNKRDNIKQIIIKIFFIISLIALIISAGYLADYFLAANKQDKIIDNTRELWHSASSAYEYGEPDIYDVFLKENPDFCGWITINNTKIDNPIYKTTDNEFYLDHNQQKKKSVYGALFFDYNNVITEDFTDTNLIIYGHEMKNGSMFGNLKKLKNLNFYKQNSTVEFSTLYKTATYKIYAIFLLNASRKDDNGYIYNITRQNFIDENDFNSWTNEAYERSIINTNVDTKFGDNIITLVTCSEDFKDARLVVMAREIREDETDEIDTSSATVNPSPRYPKKWYDERNIEYPFN